MYAYTHLSRRDRAQLWAWRVIDRNELALREALATLADVLQAAYAVLGWAMFLCCLLAALPH